MTSNEERITGCEKDIDNLKNNNVKIWQQVSNHIPTQIRELVDKNDNDHKRIYDKLDKITWYIAIGLIATTLVQIILKEFLK